MSYISTVQYLFAQTQSQGIKLGLDNCKKVHAVLGAPCEQFKCVHVAGTNGKGSVTVKTAAGLQAAGYRVGRYTSPHISTFRERIAINGEMIAEEEVVGILSETLEASAKVAISLTFFELTTLLAFVHFARQRVDYAVIETGLGGRLDATNIIPHPILSVITSISLDHVDYLGTTLEAITREKAGIIKANVPVIIGPSVAISQIQPIAKSLQSPVHAISTSFLNSEAENRALARKCLELLQMPDFAIAKGLEAALPCRYEKVSERIILDVAHNPEGIKALFKRIQVDYPDMPVHVVCGFSKNKDIRSCLEELACRGQSFYFVASGARALPAADLQLMFKEISPKESVSHLSIPQAIAQATSKEGLVIVCGTFFIMHAVRAALGIEEAADPIALRE